jgi:hypothetical protein
VIPTPLPPSTIGKHSKPEIDKDLIFLSKISPCEIFLNNEFFIKYNVNI